MFFLGRDLEAEVKKEIREINDMPMIISMEMTIRNKIRTTSMAADLNPVKLISALSIRTAKKR